MASPFTHRELRRAAGHLAARRVAPGLDGMAPSDLSAADYGKLTTKVYALLRGNRWRPYRARRGLVPRPGKAPRLHCISTMRDAVVLKAAADVLGSIWDHLHQAFAGGRPCGSYRPIIEAISRFIAEGGGRVFRFDLQGAFANADFDKAIRLLRVLTDRQDVVDLIARWRAAQGRAFPGLVEGSPVAPLLLAVLLNDAAAALATFGDVYIWIDDGIVLCRDEAAARAAEQAMRDELEKVGGLKLHPRKTGVHPASRATSQPSDWDFLGFRWRRWLAEPLPKAVEKLLSRVEADFRRRTKAADIRESIEGWLAYYAVPNVYGIGEVEDRLWPWGPFRPLTSSHLTVALRGPRGPRARRYTVPGVSAGGGL